MAEDAKVTDARGGPDAQLQGTWVPVEKSMLSRLLYPNPVCLLAACDGEDDAKRNIMTITWLTPINNQGGFVCSMNAGRHSASIAGKPGAVFVLNVPVRGMEELVLSIGGSSGSEVDKLKELDIATCAPGGGALAAESRTSEPVSTKKRKLSKKEIAKEEIAAAASQSFALSDCVAHLLCRVDRVTEDDGHLLLRCSQVAAWVRSNYWDGRNFIPRDEHAEPYLTFLGSKQFGYVVQSTGHAGSM